ncbi:hypothetical protein [Gymnodinialimonas sp. 57CJ19]|uniref:hypothetical protein n=1 Tax=Gymnodinialimonas sp. 57CJ19 TaxID=3138498 RepID=UPI0031343B01
MSVVLITFVAIFFSAYAFFDSMAIISRSSASVVGLNAFGASIEKVMNTLKRLMIFLYPPVLGFFVIQNDAPSIFLAILFSYLCASVIQLLIVFKRRKFLRYFCAVAEQFLKGSSIIRSLRLGFCSSYMISDGFSKAESGLADISSVGGILSDFRGLITMASWIYFVFGASIFSLNILAIMYSEFAPVILQFLGLFNGLGTVVLAFYVDPIVSRFLDKSERLDDITVALLVAQLFSYTIISPFYYIILMAVSMNL